MRILMLGWEFPPFIAGGLGTACYGLTKGLDRLGHEVVFVLPKPVDRAHASHIKLLSPAQRPTPSFNGLNGAQPVSAGGLGKVDQHETPALQDAAAHAASGTHGPLTPEQARALGLVGADAYQMSGFQHASFRSIPAGFASPYPAFHAGHAKGGMFALTSPSGHGQLTPRAIDPTTGLPMMDLESHAIARAMEHEAGAADRIPAPVGGTAYEGDMVANAERYARLVVAIARTERFDVIHAHDWMTFPAGIALATVTGKPLIAHVHATEFDRSGDHINQRVYDIERRGMHAASRVVCVSNLTQSIVARRYGVALSKTDVVYNGIDNQDVQPHEGDMIESQDRIVLFLGRITMQKGPEYFIRAAKRVLEKEKNVKFVVAGSGDMAIRMIEEAAHLGIGHKVLFTGFLRGRDVDRVFRMADVYVMPSVSEPFGIAPLEAMRNDVPVIISKQSGVSEVLTHALKVDFWDIDEMANKIVAVLRHPPLGQTLREHGAFELRRLTWDGAAAKCVQVYGRALSAVGVG
jgi:glycosyltransferase involved in cell wall biosynthesis